MHQFYREFTALQGFFYSGEILFDMGVILKRLLAGSFLLLAPVIAVQSVKQTNWGPILAAPKARQKGDPNAKVVIVEYSDFTLAILKELKRLGVRISMDDFGTGYSSLSQLKHFPSDTLKIDRSFIKDLASDPKEEAIVSAIIVLAHSLGMDVVAEGVETPEELAIVKKHHCDKMQGYLFSRPIPVIDFETLLRSGKTL